MPPRPRKTAAAKPGTDPATLDTPESAPVDTGTAGTAPETDGQAQADAAAVTDPAADAPPAPDAVADNPAVAPTEPSDDVTPAPTARAPEPAAPAFHWETATGAPGNPCRLCLPGGALETAGSIGCQHGQWVRVWDGNQ